MNRRIAVYAALSAVLVAAFALTATPASGAAKAKPGGASAQRLGFVLSVKGSDSFIKLRARAGQRRAATLVVVNTTRKTKIVDLAVTDAATAAYGGFDFAGGRPSATGAWVTLSRTRVRMPPGARQYVKVRIAVPAGARGGQHYAGIVAVDAGQKRALETARAKQRQRFQVNLLSRAGIAVQIDLPHRPLLALALRRTKIEISPSGPTIALALDNVGNRLIRTSEVRLRVSRAGRVLFSRAARIAQFLPESGISYRFPWTGRLQQGTYHVSGTVRPQGGRALRIDSDVRFGEKGATELERETGRVAPAAPGRSVPPWLYGVLGAGAMLVCALAFALLGRRRRRRDGGGDGSNDAQRAPRSDVAPT